MSALASAPQAPSGAVGVALAKIEAVADAAAAQTLAAEIVALIAKDSVQTIYQVTWIQIQIFR